MALCNLEAKENLEHISFLHILANSGQSSGGHTALLIGNVVYHFQYNFNDKILHLIRDPWEEFRFHYTVWENRSIHLIELGIPDSKKLEFKSKWDEAYIIQKKWIQNLEDIKADERWFSNLSRLTPDKGSSFPISGLGYFKKDIPSSEEIVNLNELEKSEVKNSLALFHSENIDFEKLFDYNQTILKQNNLQNISDFAFQPPLRYQSLFHVWENLEQKKFVREFILNPIKFDITNFIVMNSDPSFKIEEIDRDFLKSWEINLEDKIKECLKTANTCNGIEEIVLIVRLFAIKESLRLGYFVIPKKANYNPFYYEDFKEIPQSVLEEKKKESVRYFDLAKKQFYEKKSDFVWSEWEKDLSKIYSLQNQKFDIINFEPYPSIPGERSFENPKMIQEMGFINMDNFSTQRLEYEQFVQKIYPYHIILQNCTGEIFRYHNHFFKDETDAKQTLGGIISHQTSSLSFIPFVAANKVREEYQIRLEKKILSYRLQKKRESKITILQQTKEDFVPLSEYYQKNPYDQDFLFFTDDTVALRPIYGLSNLFWGVGHTSIGIVTSPWDKGKKFTTGVKSIFFSFPEIFFFNIRKGYFPYVTEKELPASYYEKVYE